ncbi:hypothetical protein F511_34627 [Dorcoceras hygrometricum]|uniref:Uncharacterized protein n=1 Tax=Dorcoceras hygrometricum TaxID=472368 RepID=A0A2Z7B120_9LAMI|nr:hypothetical protein F511_34627 [Dorcoceras hygrometricum]
MAESDGSLVVQNQTLDSLYAALDPKSLILSQFSGSGKTEFLQLTTDSFILERGPRYKEYSDLREKRKRMKNLSEQPTPEKERGETLQNRSVLTPPRKQVKFHGSSDFKTPPRRPKGPSILTQSVPDFSSALRKENRKPASPLPPINERSVTPPAGLLKSRRLYGNVGGGSKSTGSAEKRIGGLMARKSYASINELKGLASVAGKAIDRESRGRSSRGIGKSFLG